MPKEPAGLLRRLGAIIYDALLVLALLFVTSIPFVAMSGGEAVESSNTALYSAYQLTMIAVTYLFFVGFWMLKGRTLGMQSWRLRVEKPDGRSISLSEASIRFLVAGLSLGCAGLGFVWQLFDRDRLTWHDRLSDTRLVYYPKESLDAKLGPSA